MTQQQNVVMSETKSEVVAQNKAQQGGGYISISRRSILKNLEINGRVNGLIESMKASSPTHSSLSQYQTSWIVHHPSALDMFDQIMEASKGKQIVMFLDYDGTLSPIVEDPDRAYMSNSMRKTVRKLARCFPTAIVTGRCKDKDRKAETLIFQPATQFLPMIDHVYQQLVDKMKPIPGSMVEHNKFCVSIHFRCVDEKKWIELAHQVKSVLKNYPKLRLTQGRKVLEIRPNIKWDKGKALEFLLESLGKYTPK
ncbi:hypothetical protein TanjilG_11042 [Lupinus angustifolius]|uniref:trehalose-phosphatase n=1 Tax=Lupinus angustifolius TaxID=3871 RepID=A0A1J7GAX3_LUPAN|nr:hypothetical protein TanjilG_11042 [Lupinus angustifolius]